MRHLYVIFSAYLAQYYSNICCKNGSSLLSRLKYVFHRYTTLHIRIYQYGRCGKAFALVYTCSLAFLGPVAPVSRAEAHPPRVVAGAAEQHRVRGHRHLPPDVRDAPGDAQAIHSGGRLHTGARAGRVVSGGRDPGDLTWKGALICMCRIMYVLGSSRDNSKPQ